MHDAFPFKDVHEARAPQCSALDIRDSCRTLLHRGWDFRHAGPSGTGFNDSSGVYAISDGSFLRFAGASAPGQGGLAYRMGFERLLGLGNRPLGLSRLQDDGGTGDDGGASSMLPLPSPLEVPPPLTRLGTRYLGAGIATVDWSRIGF